MGNGNLTKQTMRKLIYVIIITIIFRGILEIVFDKLYALNIISGLFTGIFIGFIIFKIYSILLLLFCIYKLLIYRNVKDKQKEWFPVTILSLLFVVFCFLFLNI